MGHFFWLFSDSALTTTLGWFFFLFFVCLFVCCVCLCVCVFLTLLIFVFILFVFWMLMDCEWRYFLHLKMFGWERRFLGIW